MVDLKTELELENAKAEDMREQVSADLAQERGIVLAEFQGIPDDNMREEITVRATLIYDCPAAQSRTQQSDAIYRDLIRLLDADSTTGVACLGATLTEFYSEAETYGSIDVNRSRDIQAHRMLAALQKAYPDDESDPSTLVLNALCDLRHLCHVHGLNHAMLDQKAFHLNLVEVK